MGLCIIDTFSSAGSGSGLSHYKPYLGCAKQARYLEENPEPSSPAAATGIYGHRLLESYFKGETIHEVMISEHTSDDESFNKALTCVKQFKKKYPVDIFGRPLAIEKHIRTNDPNVVGISPFTCRIDLMTRVHQDTVKELPKEFELFDPINLIEPGYWLVDHKFFSQKRMNMETSLIDDLQFTAYPLAWNATQKQQVKGTLVNVIIMTKKIRNILVVVPLPDYNKVKSLHNAMALIHQRMTAPELEANPLFCETYFGTCPAKKAGYCCGY